MRTINASSLLSHFFNNVIEWSRFADYDPPTLNLTDEINHRNARWEETEHDMQNILSNRFREYNYTEYSSSTLSVSWMSPSAVGSTTISVPENSTGKNATGVGGNGALHAMMLRFQNQIREFKFELPVHQVR